MFGKPILPVLALVATSAFAGTAQDFDGGGDPYQLGQHGAGSSATVVAGGPTGSFLRLASGASGNSLNTIGFDRTDTGASCTVTIDFDFRIIPGSGSADGFGVSLLDVSQNGAEGVTAGAEEPGFDGSVGVGFDVYQNGGDPNDNHVSVHFDNGLVSATDAGSVVDLDGTGGQFIHARVTIAVGATSGDVSVELTPPGGSATTLINALPVPGLEHYEGRIQFGARTGGATADHDLDNISVTYAGCPDVLGQWGNVLPIPIVGIHADLLPTGEVLLWDRDDVAAGDVPPILFNPLTEQVVNANDPGYDLFCSGHSYLPDGTLFVSGGHDGADQYGLPYGTLYDATTGNWTTVPAQMNDGRWYPTNTTLPNGDQLVVTGTIQPGSVNQLPQVFEVATQTWRDLTTATRSVPLYSFFHLAPNGMAFNSGPETTTRYLDTSGTGAWITVDSTGGVYRSFGSSTPYDDGKIVLVGGGDPPTETVQVIDLNDATPDWRFVDSMDFARRQLNVTILADGKIMATGGTASAGFNVVDDAVFAGEIWDPATESWSMVGAAQIPRIYHSFGLLLPDGRVLTGGSGHPPGGGPPGDMDHFDLEIYSPAYLFQGTRPTITTAPPNFGHGDSFFVETPDAANIGAVHLIRLAAVTHSFNQNQWINRLSFTTTPGGLTITAPADGIEAPPGPYMLFLLDNSGVPSVAPIVSLLPDAGGVPSTLIVDKAGSDVTLTWDPSCEAEDSDYSIYEGTIGDFGNRIPVICSTGGATNSTFSPGSGDVYYLVVPRNTASEGSYGRDGAGAQRLPAPGACRPQSLGTCF